MADQHRMHFRGAIAEDENEAYACAARQSVGHPRPNRWDRQEWRTVSESAPAMTSTMLLYTLMLPYTFQKVVRPWPEWSIGLRRLWGPYISFGIRDPCATETVNSRVTLLTCRGDRNWHLVQLGAAARRTGSQKLLINKPPSPREALPTHQSPLPPQIIIPFQLHPFHVCSHTHFHP
jgi:hypothetical protein